MQLIKCRVLLAYCVLGVYQLALHLGQLELESIVFVEEDLSLGVLFHHLARLNRHLESLDLEEEFVLDFLE